MRKILLVTALATGQWALGSNVATQTVTFSVCPISEISISGDPPSLVATSAAPGTDMSEVTDNSTYHSITTNGSSENLIVTLDSPMPAGTMLCFMASPPTGAVSHCLELDSNNQTAISGITQIAEGNLQISYTFKASVAAGIISPTSRIVTFTLTP